MRRSFVWLFPALLVVVMAAGCGNPIKREPANVFPGTESYVKRVDSFKISPSQAYDIALDQARTDNKLQFLSRRPTVVVKRSYVFSMPQPSGASLQGYHVNGDTGAVKFMEEKKTIAHNKR